MVCQDLLWSSKHMDHLAACVQARRVCGCGSKAGEEVRAVKASQRASCRSPSPVPILLLLLISFDRPSGEAQDLLHRQRSLRCSQSKLRNNDERSIGRGAVLAVRSWA